jgi:hypothetical protein
VKKRLPIPDPSLAALFATAMHKEAFFFSTILKDLNDLSLQKLE